MVVQEVYPPWCRRYTQGITGGIHHPGIAGGIHHPGIVGGIPHPGYSRRYTTPWVYSLVHHPGYTARYTTLGIPASYLRTHGVPRTALGVLSVQQRGPGLSLGISHG